MATIKVIDFDGVTPFNDVPVEKINEAWKGEAHVLVYKDDEFTGIAQPKGIKTTEYWQEHFQAFYDEQEEAEKKAQEEAENQQSQLDRIESTLTNVESGTSQLLTDIRTETIDQYTLELVEAGLL